MCEHMESKELTEEARWSMTVSDGKVGNLYSSKGFDQVLLLRAAVASRVATRRAYKCGLEPPTSRRLVELSVSLQWTLYAL